MPNRHGEFVWYELLTSNSDEALRFYNSILGWCFTDPDQANRGYRRIQKVVENSGMEHAIGGVMQLTEGMCAAGARPAWLGYIGVDDVAQSVARIAAAGGGVQMPPTDIPGVGRIAMVTDPQGVPFYVMRSNSDEASLAFASDKPRVGHCAWNELITVDPEAAKVFYFDEFGWSKDGAMDMGPMGSYEFVRHNGVIGAIMPKPEEMPVPMWHYYFRCADIDTALKTIIDNGGEILQGPDEIPGGDFTLKGIDPQGALFSLVGTRK